MCRVPKQQTPEGMKTMLKQMESQEDVMVRMIGMVLVGGFVSVGVALGQGTAIGGERLPNVVILMPDQMAGDAMGVAGNPDVKTPRMDRLAAEGVYLPNTIANHPVCCPARATILTGLYPHGHGVISNDLRLRESKVTLAEILAAEGYATAFIGKWHLDGGVRMPGFVPPGPRRQGFAFWAANECNHNHFDPIYFYDTPEPIRPQRFETEVWADEAVRFIRENKDRPFFLEWTCGPPHNPYKAPEKYRAMYDPDKLTMRGNWEDVKQHGTREDIAHYYGMVTAIDDAIGRILDELDRLELTRETLVIFTSDHGDMLGSHGLAMKTKPWEESIRIPGIVRYPSRIEAGQTRDLLFSHVDIAPTVMGFCGIAPASWMHGEDLSRVLRGIDQDDVEAVYLEINEPRPHMGVPDSWRGVRTKRYAYARFVDKPWVLYDLEADPDQMRNLVGVEEHAEIEARLDRMLQAEMARTGDRWSVDLEKLEIFYQGPAMYDPRFAE
jgi:arylsulfatase A-like enzyme